MPEQQLDQENHSTGTGAENALIVLQGGFLTTSLIKSPLSRIRDPAREQGDTQRHSSGYFPLIVTFMGHASQPPGRQPCWHHVWSCAFGPLGVVREKGKKQLFQWTRDNLLQYPKAEDFLRDPLIPLLQHSPNSCSYTLHFRQYPSISAVSDLSDLSLSCGLCFFCLFFCCLLASGY